MSDFDALTKGMALFNDGMQKFSTSRAINLAQEQVQSLNDSEMDEMKKRQQMSQISQNLALNLTKGGASASAVQQAAGVLMPAAVKDSNDANMQGLLTGSQPLLDVAAKAQPFEAAVQVSEKAKDRAFTASESALTRENALKLAGIKADGKPLKALSDKQVDFVSSLDDSFAIGNQLTKELEASPWLSGPAAGRIPGRGVVDPKFASFQQGTQAWFDEYRKNITGAGASESELVKLEQNRPTVKDSPSQFRAKALRIVEVGQGVRKRKLQNLERAGRDVRKFNVDSSDSSAQAPAAEEQAPAAAAPKQFDASRWLIKK